jgi:hypothetical protein
VGSIHVITSNGTFTTSPVFKHIVLLAVSHDGNNELVLLAYAICDVENERNWTWIGQQLAKDFEGAKAVVADFDKGIQAMPSNQLCLVWGHNLGAAYGI